MRKLTQTEIFLAPAWATDYAVRENDWTPHIIVYYGDNQHQIYYKELKRFAPVQCGTKLPEYAGNLYAEDSTPAMERIQDASANYWHTRDGRKMLVTDMTPEHLENALKFLKRAAKPNPNDESIAILEAEVKRRDDLYWKGRTRPSQLKAQFTERECICGQSYIARTADLKRGWAKSCSKSCAAVRRERTK